MPDNLLGLVKRRIRKSNLKQLHATVRFDESSLTVTRTYSDESAIVSTVAWSDVTQVIAYKRDLFVYDLVCLAFWKNSEAVEIDEEMEGWGSLVTALPHLLSGFPALETWWNQVTQPPFATNAIQLYLSE